MASPIGHTLVGIGAAVVVSEVTGTPTQPIFWLGAVLASNVPDLDLIGVALGLSLRRAHRQATHSLLVLGTLAVASAWVLSLLPIQIESGVGFAWSAALFSHPILDIVVTGPRLADQGYGIPLFWPVSARRWFVRRPVFHTVPLGAYLTDAGVWKALLSEFCVFGPLPIILVVLGQVF